MNMDSFRSDLFQTLNIPADAKLQDDCTFADLLIHSPTAINSIDLMEAFTFTLMSHELSDRVNMPACTLDSHLSEVLDAIKSQVLR